MAKNIKNYASEKSKVTERKIVSILLICLFALAAVITTVVIIINNKEEDNRLGRFDYVKEDLSRYIYISSENYTGYKGYEIQIAMDEVDRTAAYTALMQDLAKNRSKDYIFSDPTGTIEIGDDALLYFQAYYTEDGVTKGKEVTGLGNFSIEKESSRTFTIGGGELDKYGLNLEQKLLGKSLNEHTSCLIDYDGEINGDDIVFITYTALVNKDGKGEVRSGEKVRINLSDSDVDSVWGNGFREMLLGMIIDKEYTTQKNDIFTTEDYDAVMYTKIKVDYVMRLTSEDSPIRVSTTVPSTVSSVSLQGKKVIFEIYAESVKKYDVPEFNESFITDIMKLDLEKIQACEGDTLEEKYISYKLAQLKKDQEAETESIRVKAMWQHLYSIAQIKSYPEIEVARLVERETKVLRDAYGKDEKYAEEYGSFEAFAQAYVGAQGSELVWSDYLRQSAQAEIKEKLIFYYVAKAEGLLPDDASFKAISERIAASDSYYKELTDEGEREEYLTYAAHVEYAVPKMSQFGTVKFTNPAKDNVGE